MIKFDPTWEVNYRQRQFQRILPLFRGVLLFTLVTFLISILWDFYLDPVAGMKTIIVRAILALLTLGYWCITLFPMFQKQLRLLLLSSTVINISGISLILLLLPNGFQFGLSRLLFYGLACMVLAPDARTLLSACFIICLMPNMVMFSGQVPLPVVLLTNVSLVPLCLLAVAFSFLLDQSNRRTFLLEKKLEQLATTDPLTEVNNRRHCLELGQKELLRTRRHQHPLSLLLMDIDHFKQVNDTFGHAAGDAALKVMASTCLRLLRTCDIFGRWGGEEFIAILPETDTLAATVLAERIRQSIAELVVLEDGQPIRFTVSIGVSTYQPEDATIDIMLKRADQALYEAKKGGRNCVTVAAV